MSDHNNDHFNMFEAEDDDLLSLFTDDNSSSKMFEGFSSVMTIAKEHYNGFHNEEMSEAQFLLEESQRNQSITSPPQTLHSQDQHQVLLNCDLLPGPSMQPACSDASDAKTFITLSNVATNQQHLGMQQGAVAIKQETRSPPMSAPNMVSTPQMNMTYGFVVPQQYPVSTTISPPHVSSPMHAQQINSPLLHNQGSHPSNQLQQLGHQLMQQPQAQQQVPMQQPQPHQLQQHHHQPHHQPQHQQHHQQLAQPLPPVTSTTHFLPNVGAPYDYTTQQFVQVVQPGPGPVQPTAAALPPSMGQPAQLQAGFMGRQLANNMPNVERPSVGHVQPANRSNGSRKRGSTSANSGSDQDEEESLSAMPIKKRPHQVPENMKDTVYWEKRKKNNDSARRSREARRAKEEQVAMRVVYLENENLQLRTEVSLLKTDIEKLREDAKREGIKIETLYSAPKTAVV